MGPKKLLSILSFCLISNYSNATDEMIRRPELEQTENKAITELGNTIGIGSNILYYNSQHDETSSVSKKLQEHRQRLHDSQIALIKLGGAKWSHIKLAVSAIGELESKIKSHTENVNIKAIYSEDQLLKKKSETLGMLQKDTNGKEMIGVYTPGSVNQLFETALNELQKAEGKHFDQKDVVDEMERLLGFDEDYLNEAINANNNAAQIDIDKQEELKQKDINERAGLLQDWGVMNPPTANPMYQTRIDEIVRRRDEANATVKNVPQTQSEFTKHYDAVENLKKLQNSLLEVKDHIERLAVITHNNYQHIEKLDDSFDNQLKQISNGKYVPTISNHDPRFDFSDWHMDPNDNNKWKQKTPQTWNTQSRRSLSQTNPSRAIATIPTTPSIPQNTYQPKLDLGVWKMINGKMTQISPTSGNPTTPLQGFDPCAGLGTYNPENGGCE